MIKANELRIGNYIQTAYDVVAVDRKLFEVGDFENKLHPAPLTEEWLMKLGFKKRESFNFDYYERIIPITTFRIQQSERSFTVNENCTYAFMDGVFLAEIAHIHQLQNLYFALTGEELILQE